MKHEVPLRLDLTFELPGTPEQVWDAIATAGGISSWFLPTDLEERMGGAIEIHMGDEGSSSGTVTGWEPHRRFAYVEPDWAALTGHADATVSPLATEFLVEAQSGGTCVVRVVSSAFGTGAEWEREFFAEMEQGWTPFFSNLQLYLTHFPGQRAATLMASAKHPGTKNQVRAAIHERLGVDAVGQPVEVGGLKGEVDGVGELHLLVRLADPVPGFLAFFQYDDGKGTATAAVNGYLFSDDAGAFVASEPWTAWLAALEVGVPR